MSNPFIGQIVMFGGNFAPRGWGFCDGQLLPIAQNSALFSILGTTYGGDGRVNFGLPDLRGRSPMHPGTGPGLSPRQLGARGGVENVTLATAQLPSHNHNITLTASGSGSTDDVVGFATNPAAAGTATTNNSGSGQSHTNLGPFGCVNFIIAIFGTFPSRS